MITVNIIGAGAVGQTLGYLLAHHQLAIIQAIHNQSAKSTQHAIAFIGQGQRISSVRELPSADVFLITVPDQQIAQIAEELANNPYLQTGTIVLHCSGALSSDCLKSLRTRGCKLVSLHPSFSFKDPLSAINQFVSIPCAIEGDKGALETITRLFTGIGAQVYQIETANKALYHVAAVFGSNYVVTLLQQAYDCFLAAGLSKAQTKQVIEALLPSVVENIKRAYEPKGVLTGPIQRGDMTTIQQHLHVLTDAEIREFYVFMAKKTLAIANLEDAVEKQFTMLFETDQ